MRSQVERILASPDFPGSERHARLLRFLTEASAQDGDGLDAYTIATEVLERGASFDPTDDPIVRVEVGRLRRALEAYYLKHPESSLRIEIPKGAYRAQLRPTAPPSEPLEKPRESRPALVILPFVNSASAELDYLAHGLTEELLLALTRFEDIRVYVYRDELPQRSNEAEVGRAIGARFVLTGTTHVADGAIRVTVRLTDSDTLRQLWGMRFDRELSTSSLFSIQDEVASGIAVALVDTYGVIPRTLGNESRGRRTESLDAYGAVLKFHDGLWRWDETSFTEARRALERAVRADDSYAWPLAALAGLYVNDYQYYLVDDPEEALVTAERLARKAVSMDPQCHRSRWSMAYLYYCKHEREPFEKEVEVALSLNPHHASMIGELGVLLALADSWSRGVHLVQKSMAMNPFYPRWYHGAFSTHAYVEGRFEDALAEAERMDLPDFWWNPAMRAACLVRLGRIEKANAQLARLRGMTEDLERKTPHIVRAVILSDSLASAILDDLRAAGLSI